MTDPQIIPRVAKFFTQRARYYALYGGRASGKTWSAAIHSILMGREYRVRTLCLRQFQSNIQQSVYTVLKDTIFRLELQREFDMLSTEIRHKRTGSTWQFYGIARNIQEIRGIEGVDVTWIEEAAQLTQEQWDILRPTLIRNDYSMIWLIWNPLNRTDFVWQRFVEHPHDHAVVMKQNYTDNPFLPQPIKEDIEELNREDEESYKHIYLGVPNEGDEKALFTFVEIEESISRDAAVDMSGAFTMAVDVARYGKDSSVVSKRRGYKIFGLTEYRSYSTTELASATAKVIQELDRRPNAVFVDTIGVGAGVFDRLEELGHNGLIEANVSMKADDNDTYYNKRAEIYFRLRDWVRKGGMLPNDADLKEELLAITYSFAPNGKMKIDEKDKIKEKIGRSPDKADSVALHFFSDVVVSKTDIEALQRKMMMRR